MANFGLYSSLGGHITHGHVQKYGLWIILGRSRCNHMGKLRRECTYIVHFLKGLMVTLRALFIDEKQPLLRIFFWKLGECHKILHLEVFFFLS